MQLIHVEFGVHRATNAGHVAILTDLLGLAGTEFAQQQGLTEAFTKVNNLLEVEKLCHGPIRALDNTEEVERLDGVRDRLFVYCTKVIAAATLLPLNEMAQAGIRLEKQFTPFKGASTQPYEDNTSMVATLLQRIATAESQADIQTLGLTPVIQALNTTNHQFNEAYLYRTSDLQQRATGETMKTIRPKVDVALREYLQAINTVYQFNELITKDATKRATLIALIDRRLGTGGPDTENGTDIENGNTENGSGENTPSGDENTGSENGATSGENTSSGPTTPPTGEDIPGGNENENTGGGSEGGTTSPPPAGNNDDEEIVG